MAMVDHQSDYVDELLTRLDSVVSDLAELSLTSLPVEQLNRVLLRECELVSQAQGLQMAAIQEAENAAMSVRYGNRILTTHLAKETHQPTKALGSARSIAMWLNDFPLIHEALKAGDISRSHVMELKGIDNPRVHHLMVRDQNMLVKAAQEVVWTCLLYTSPSPRDATLSRMPSSA